MTKRIGARLSHYGYRVFELWDAYTNSPTYADCYSARTARLLEVSFTQLQWWGALLEGRLVIEIEERCDEF